MKQVFKSLSFIVIIGLAASCGGPQGEKAQTGDAQEVSVATGDVSLKVDVAASNVEWTGAKPTGQHNGTISISDGSVMLSNGVVVGGKFTIDMNSIVNSDLTSEEDNAKLVGHLKSPDFFDVAKYPTAVFEITGADAVNGTPGVTHNITGNLTMKDVTKSITFPAMVKIEDNKLTAETPAFVIDRTQWNVQYGSKTLFDNLKDKFINDEISLKINLTAEM
ncbi:MAG: YceI family protein [Lentimicrobiaceae bacterium]|nr:YceI family protein [Lentimicrobiaceae bacterium]MCB9023342.1 YceI family protein [Lentimicrobiaceae bacterium]MCO5265747.1 YceI family protein [Lentimicrobium sp.]HPG32771.1 YceI family protein [Lentimicrobium sp.]